MEDEEIIKETYGNRKITSIDDDELGEILNIDPADIKKLNQWHKIKRHNSHWTVNEFLQEKDKYGI